MKNDTIYRVSGRPDDDGLRQNRTGISRNGGIDPRWSAEPDWRSTRRKIDPTSRRNAPKCRKPIRRRALDR